MMHRAIACRRHYDNGQRGCQCLHDVYTEGIGSTSVCDMQQY